MTPAHHTGPVFPDIPEKQDLRDLGVIRGIFTASLPPVCEMIDILREIITLFAG